MKIYFAGSIRGGREDAQTYFELIQYIGTLATVLTEHISDEQLSVRGEENLSDPEIYARDMNWLNACDAVIAEVTAPSLGVGYEIGMAQSADKPVLCLFRTNGPARLSAMLSGNPGVRTVNYSAPAEARTAIAGFIAGLQSQPA